MHFGSPRLRSFGMRDLVGFYYVVLSDGPSYDRVGRAIGGCITLCSGIPGSTVSETNPARQSHYVARIKCPSSIKQSNLLLVSNLTGSAVTFFCNSVCWITLHSVGPVLLGLSIPNRGFVTSVFPCESLLALLPALAVRIKICFRKG